MIISGHTKREAETVAFFKQEYEKVYTLEEARSISGRLTEGFMLLAKWAKEQRVFETINEKDSGDCNSEKYERNKIS